MVIDEIDMVTTTCDLGNDDSTIIDKHVKFQSDNMTVDFDDEVSLVDNEIISVATCMVSVLIHIYINKYIA